MFGDSFDRFSTQFFYRRMTICSRAEIEYERYTGMTYGGYCGLNLVVIDDRLLGHPTV